ncbi:MAG: hypothetical protein AB7P07_12885 [Hyphomonadaceae bacterium]
MTIRNIAVAVFLASLTFAPGANADLPDSLRAAGVSVAQWQAVQTELSRVSRARSVSERGLATAAERLGLALVETGRDPAAAIGAVLDAIDGQAEQLHRLQERLATLEGSADPDVAALLAQASAAIDEGRFDEADLSLAQAEASDLAAIERAEVESQTRRARVAATIAQRGELSLVQADFIGAATHYERAASVAPERSRERWESIVRQANALKREGVRADNRDFTRRAVRLLRESALPLAPRETSPDDWAATQIEIGATLLDLADRPAIDEAVAANYAALEVYNREDSRDGWLTAWNNLANAFMIYGDEASVRQSIEIHQRVLAFYSRERDAQEWADSQNNIGSAYYTLAARTRSEIDVAAAAAAYQLAIDAYDAGSMTWAWTRFNLASLQSFWAQYRDPAKAVDAMVNAEAALAVFEREGREYGIRVTRALIREIQALQ